MNINRIVQRAIDDPQFAKKLRDIASRAKTGGVDSPEWEALLKQFGTSVRELAQLNSAAGCQPGSSAFMQLLEAIRDTDLSKGSSVFKRFGTNSRQIAQLKMAGGCSPGSTAVNAIDDAIQTMHLHAKPR